MINTPKKRNEYSRDLSRRAVLVKLNNSKSTMGRSIYPRKGGVDVYGAEKKKGKIYKPTKEEILKSLKNNFNIKQVDMAINELKQNRLGNRYRKVLQKEFNLKDASLSVMNLLKDADLVKEAIAPRKARKELVRKEIDYENYLMGRNQPDVVPIVPDVVEPEDYEFYDVPEMTEDELKYFKEKEDRYKKRQKRQKKIQKYLDAAEEDEEIENLAMRERLENLADPGALIPREEPRLPRLKKGEYERLYRPSARREIIPPGDIQNMERALIPSRTFAMYPEYVKSNLLNKYGNLDIDDINESEYNYPEDIYRYGEPEELDYDEPVRYDLDFIDNMARREGVREQDIMDYLESIENFKYPTPKQINKSREDYLKPYFNEYDVGYFNFDPPAYREPPAYMEPPAYREPVVRPLPTGVAPVDLREPIAPVMREEDIPIAYRPPAEGHIPAYELMHRAYPPADYDYMPPDEGEESEEEEEYEGSEEEGSIYSPYSSYDSDTSSIASYLPPAAPRAYVPTPYPEYPGALTREEAEAELAAEVEKEIKRGLKKKEIKAKLKDPKSFAEYYEKIVAKIRKRMDKEEKERAIEFYKNMRGTNDVSSEVKNILNQNFAKYMRDRGITDPNMIQGPISGGNRGYIDKNRKQEFYRKYRNPVELSAYGNLLNKQYYNSITQTIGDCHNYSNSYNYYGGEAKTGNVLHLRNEDYPKYLIKVKDILSINPKNTVIIGSRSYDELAIYPSDLDLLEFIVEDSEISTINTFINGIRKIVAHVVNDKNFWFDHVKLGIDDRYPDPSKIGKFTGTFIPSADLIKKINYLYSMDMFSDPDYDFLTQKSYNLIGYDMYREILKKYRTLRWSAGDIDNGFIQLIDGNTLTIYDACKQDAPINIEVVAIVGSDIVRVSNFFVLGYKKNGIKYGINTDDSAARSDINYTIKNLKRSIEELYFSSNFNPLKMIKRINSFIAIKGNVRKDLGDVIKLLYKSPGFMYYAKTKIDTIRTLYSNGINFPYELATNELIYIEEMIGRSEISNKGKDLIYSLINKLIEIFEKPLYSDDTVVIKILDELYDLFDLYTYSTLNTLEKERFRNFNPPLDRYLPDKKDRIYLVNDSNRLRKFHELEKKYKHLL